MVEPISPALEFFLTVYSLLPVSIVSFISLFLGLFTVLALINLFFKVK